MAGVDAPIRDNPPATGAERLVHLFVHDLRAPLGVATGYIRLLQDGRLASDVEQRLALTRTLDALGRIASLCDAMAGAAADDAEPGGVLTPEDLVARVAAALKPPARLESADGWPAGSAVAVGRDGDRFAKSLALVLNAVARRGLAPVVAAAPSGSGVHVTLNARPDARSSEAAPFDPWRGFGLEVVLACQAINATGGRVTAGGEADLAIDLPFVRPDASAS